MNSDVNQAGAGYVASKTLSDRYNCHYLDEAKDVLGIAQFAYEHGGLALLDYLSALQDNRDDDPQCPECLSADVACYPSTELCNSH